MKRSFLMILILVYLSFIAGCGQTPESALISPVCFYYHNNLDTKDDFELVFVQEVREGSYYQGDHVALLNHYLDGPESQLLVNPFPSGLRVISMEIHNDTASVLLSDHITKLTGIDLTMSCSCLSLTLFELIQCEYVEIVAENGQISGQGSIIIAKESFLLTDDTQLITED